MSFWKFMAAANPEDDVELRIEGDIVSSDDSWFYEWLDIPHASPNTFRQQLSEHKDKNLTVWVDSFGGDVFAGAGIYNALKEHKGKITVKIDGKAMSAASVIAMAGDEIQMSPLAILMIHNPWTITWGDSNDMRHEADVLDTIRDGMVTAYAAKTGKSKNKLCEMLDNETWMSAKTALKEGFVDKIMYTDPGVGEETGANAMFFNRKAVMASVSDSIKRAMEIFKNNHPELAPPAPTPEPEPKPEPEPEPTKNELTGRELLNYMQKFSKITERRARL